MIAAAILAAGASTRLGRPKQLVEHEGQSLLARTVEAARGASCEPIVVVLGADGETIGATLAGLPVQAIKNPGWPEGIASSIRAAVGFLAESGPPDVEAVLLLTSDQPRITPEVLRSVCDRYDRSPGRMVACEYAGAPGVPALFDRTLFPDLLRLQGDRGAKSLLLYGGESVLRVAWPDGAIDVDRPGDLTG